MKFEYNEWYHVYNRGNNRQNIFFTRKNYLFFLKKCRKQLLHHSNIIAYCLMPNHFHFLLHIKPKQDEKPMRSHPLVRKIATMLSSYAQAINKQENRSGSLFRAKTKAKKLRDGNDFYGLTCFHYIHQNPVKAGLVQQLKDWKFSSYRDFAGIRNGTLADKDMAFHSFSIKNERHFRKCSLRTLDTKMIKKIF
jgi:putative transposase